MLSIFPLTEEKSSICPYTVMKQWNRLSITTIFCFGGVTHACRKRRLKWVATLPLRDINTEAWSSGMGVERGAKQPYPVKKENCREASKKFSRILWRRPRPKLSCGAKERKKIVIALCIQCLWMKVHINCCLSNILYSKRFLWQFSIHGRLRLCDENS
jgi:hypothetical protein